MFKKFSFFISILCFLFILSACSPQGSGPNSDLTNQNLGKIQVVTTVGMLADMVENVGGDLVEVQSLMGPGVDPHVYQPTAGDVQKLQNADLVFYVGFHLEGKMVETLDNLENARSLENYFYSTDFDLPAEMDFDLICVEGSGKNCLHDPHIWFDVNLWSLGVDYVVSELSLFDAENSGIYGENGQEYFDELQNLDQWVEEQIQKIPEEQRVLITAHDAFEYFGQAYNMEVRGLQGISTATDFGLKDLENLVDFIVKRKIKAVFVESSVSSKSIEALQEGVAGEGFEVEIGGELFSDAMGNPETEEGTYVGMVRHNVNTIVNALK